MASPRVPARRGGTAFLLGGGGVFGAAEAGMLRAMFEHAVHPDLIVGTSVGAINGARLAATAERCRPAEPSAGWETGLMWANALRAFQVGMPGRAPTDRGAECGCRQMPRPSGMAGVPLDEGFGFRRDEQVLVETGVLLPDLGVAALDDQPEPLVANATREVEADDDASRGVGPGGEPCTSTTEPRRDDRGDPNGRSR
jgi:hypothetical protein